MSVPVDTTSFPGFLVLLSPRASDKMRDPWNEVVVDSHKIAGTKSVVSSSP